MDSNKAFGAALRSLRQKQQMSQEKLAAAAGLDRTYISLLELGRRSPTLDTMLALAGALDTGFSEMAREIENHLSSNDDRM